MVGVISARRSEASASLAALAGIIVTIGGCTLTTPLDGLSGGRLDAGPEAAGESDGGPEVSSDGAQVMDVEAEVSKDASTEAAVDAAPDQDAVDALPTCDAGLTLCAGACVVLSSDPANCGACGHDCLAGGCLDAVCRPRVLASGQDLPMWIALDAEFVYWTNRQEGTVAKVAKAGGPVTQLAAGQASPEGIAVDASGVYWTNRSDGKVLKVPLGGSASPVVIAEGGTKCSGIALDSTHVYWADEAAGTLKRAPKNPLQTPATVELIESSQTGAKRVLIDGDTLYWTNGAPDAGAVRKRMIPGGPTVDLALDQPGAHDLVLGGDWIYWTNWYGGSVMRTPISQLAPTVVATSPGSPAGIAIDDSYVYWTAWDSNKVLKAPLDGGAPQQLAVDQNSPFGIAVDATAIYWSSYGNGTIVTLAR